MAAMAMGSNLLAIPSSGRKQEWTWNVPDEQVIIPCCEKRELNVSSQRTKKMEKTKKSCWDRMRQLTGFLVSFFTAIKLDARSLDE